MNTSSEITYSAKELADILGMNERTIRKLAASGAIARVSRGRYLAPAPPDPQDADLAALVIDPADLEIEWNFDNCGLSPEQVEAIILEIDAMPKISSVTSRRLKWYSAREFRNFKPFRRKYSSPKC